MIKKLICTINAMLISVALIFANDTMELFENNMFTEEVPCIVDDPFTDFIPAPMYIKIPGGGSGYIGDIAPLSDELYILLFFIILYTIIKYIKSNNFKLIKH